MELSDGVAIFWGSEEELEGGYFGIKQPLDSRNITNNFAGKRNLRKFWFQSWRSKKFLLLPSARFKVKITRSFEQIKQILLQGHNLILNNLRRFDLLGGVHLSEYRSKIITSDEAVAALCQIFDKLHDLHTEAVGLDPKFELRVLCLDLLDEAVERKVDFVAQVLKLLGTQVRVVVDHAFHLWPEDLLTALVEEAALVFVVEAGLADNARFAAVGVTTEGEAWLAIDALRTVGAQLSHWCNNKYYGECVDHELAHQIFNPTLKSG